MRKSKQGKHKKTKGTNLKTSPLKTYKKQVKRMKNRLNDPVFKLATTGTDVPLELVSLKSKYQARLDGAELHLKNYDKVQEEKKAAALKAAAHAKPKVV